MYTQCFINNSTLSEWITVKITLVCLRKNAQSFGSYIFVDNGPTFIFGTYNRHSLERVPSCFHAYLLNLPLICSEMALFISHSVCNQWLTSANSFEKSLYKQTVYEAWQFMAEFTNNGRTKSSIKRLLLTYHLMQLALIRATSSFNCCWSCFNKTKLHEWTQN